jgi:hypothetical protein
MIVTRMGLDLRREAGLGAFEFMINAFSTTSKASDVFTEGDFS